MRIAVVCPMANEADGAERFVRDVLDVLGPLGFSDVRFFAVLDTVSRDGTIDRLRAMAEHEPALQVVYAPENRSVVDAYVRGYREALASGADWVLEIDAGYSHDPRQIPRFVEAIAAGADCVFGTRFAYGGSYADGAPGRYFVSRAGGWLANVLLGTRLSDMTSGYQMFRRETLTAILAEGLQSRGPFFQTEMKLRAHAWKMAEVGIVYRPSGQLVRSTSIRDALRTLLRLFWRRLFWRRALPHAAGAGR
jgi:dolichol-phosphate mannosyltransferase